MMMPSSLDVFQIRDMRSHGAACLPRYSPILMQRNTTRLQRPGIVVFKHLQQRHVFTASAHNSQVNLEKVTVISQKKIIVLPQPANNANLSTLEP